MIDFSSSTSIKSAIVKKLQEFSEWKDTILTDGVYSVLFDVITFLFEKFAYLLDFVWNETTDNAQLTSSVTAHAARLGYTTNRMSGAPGFLVMGEDPTFAIASQVYLGKDIPIKRWKLFQNQDGTSFCYAIKDMTWQTGSIQRNKKLTAGSVAVEITAGVTGLPCVAHGFLPGEQVKISGSLNYNGLQLVDPSTITNRLHIVANYVPENFIGQENVAAGYGNIQVKQGVVKNFTYIMNGVTNESFPLYSTKIDQTEIQAFLVDGNDVVLYEVEIVPDLYFVTDKSVFKIEIENFPDLTGVNVKFGDDITAKRAIAGARLKLIYAETEGSKGDIGSANVINKAATGITDSTGVEAASIVITNIDPITGGSDFQSIAEIKKTSKALSNAGFQLNSRDSWVAAIKEATYVQDAMVWTQLDLSGGNLSLVGTRDQNIHYVTAITKAGEALTNQQEQEITTNYLLEKKSPSDAISWQKIKKVGILFSIVGVSQKNIDLTLLKRKISDKLTTTYSATVLGFKEEVYKSNYWATIDSLKPELIRHETQIWYLDGGIPRNAVLLAAQVSRPASSESNAQKQILFVQNSIEFWIRRKINFEYQPAYKIAVSSGLNIVGTNTYNASGNIDYSGSRVSYQFFDIISNVVPSLTKTATTLNSSNVVTIGNRTGLVVGMTVSGLNLAPNSKITEITNTGIIVNQVTSPSGAATGSIIACMDIDPGGSFGNLNPAASDANGYVLYLAYQTKDGNGNRIGDLRLSNFDQRLDYNEQLSTISLGYEA